jgi:hypothetical protein
MIHLRHKWDAKAIEHLYRGSIFDSRPPAEPLTAVLYYCPTCKRVKEERITGHWTLEQVKGTS